MNFDFLLKSQKPKSAISSVELVEIPLSLL